MANLPKRMDDKFLPVSRRGSHIASVSNFNEVTKEFPGWNGSLNKDGFVSREECRRIELNFSSISDEIPIKLAKLDTAVKTYKRNKKSQRVLNSHNMTIIWLCNFFGKVCEKKDMQKSKTCYAQFIRMRYSINSIKYIKSTVTIWIINQIFKNIIDKNITNNFFFKNFVQWYK